MGDSDMGVGSAFASWDRELKVRAGAHNLLKVERRCVHFKEERGWPTLRWRAVPEGATAHEGLLSNEIGQEGGAVLLVRRPEGSGVVVRGLRGRGGARGREVNRLALDRPLRHQASRPIT